MELEELLLTRLAAASADELLRAPDAFEVEGTVLRTPQGSWVSFASNDYLGLSEHPLLRKALAEGAARRTGAGSSRVVTGTSFAHRDAEAVLAKLVGLPTARVFPSAYAANLALLGSLLGPGDLILSDALNHASLIDGCRLGRARVLVYRHADLDHLDALLRAHRPSARVAAIVTETAFSMDGDLADIRAIACLASEHHTALFVDEAHALGVLGPRGAGLCAASGIRPDVLIGGLGKSFGLAGGFLAGTEALGRAIDNFARTFVFSTAILPAVAHAIPTSVELVMGSDDGRARLQRHAQRVREAASALGRTVLGAAPGAIVPVVLGSPAKAMEAGAALRRQGLWVPAMRPPTVPAGTARLRITPTAAHSEAQISALVRGLSETLGSPREADHENQGDHA